MKAGDISIDLTINDSDFSVKLRNGYQLLNAFTRQIDTTSRSVRSAENHFSSLSTRFRHFMIMVASTRFALMDINQVFLSLPRSVLETSGEFERMTKLLEGLSVQADKAADALSAKNFIIGFAKNAPFEIRSLTDSFIKMKAGGLDPMDGSFKALINSVAQFGGTSDVLHRASIAIQQMAGKGVISMEELRQQLGEAVPTAMRMMADGMGLSMADLAKQVSLGIVTARPALNKMFEVMRVESAQAAEEMMKTWIGATARLKTEWELLKNAIGEGGFSAEMTRIVNDVTTLLGSSQFQSFAKDVSVAFTETAKSIKSLVETAIEYRDVIQTIAEFMAIAWGSARVMGVFKALGDGWKGVVGQMQAADRAMHSTYAKQVRSIRITADETKKAALQEVVAQENKYRQMIAQAASYEAAYKRHIDAALAYERNAQQALATAGKPVIQGGFGSVSHGKLQAEAELRHAKATREAAEQIRLMGNAQLDAANQARNLANQARVAAASTGQQASEAIRAAAASARWSATMSKMGTVFNALGGWVTALSLVVMGGIAIWQRYGEAAERSARRAIAANNAVDNVKRGIADREGLKATEEQAATLRAQIETENKSREPLTKARLDRLRSLQEELAIKEESIEQQKLLVARGDEEAYYSRLSGDQSEAISRIEVQSKEALRQIDLKFGTSPADAAQQKARLAERNKVFKDMFEAQAKSIQNQAEIYAREIQTGESALGKLSESEINARKRYIATSGEQVEEVRKRMDDFFAKNIYQKADKKDDGKFGGGNSDPLGNWLDRTREKLASINAELGKKGTGDIAKLLEDLNQIDPAKLMLNGRRVTRDDVIRNVLPGLLEGEWNQEFERNFASIGETIQGEFTRVNAELDNGSSTVQKLRDQLLDMGAAAEAAADDQRLGRIGAMLRQLDELSAKQSKLSFRDVSQNLSQMIETTRAKLADDNGISTAYASWTKDIEAFRQKIVEARLDTNEAQEAQKLFAEYVKVRYEQLNRELETPMESLARKWGDVTTQMRDATTSWANGAADALTDFVMTGKADFSSLAESIIRDLIRIQIQSAIGNSITASKGSGGGDLIGMLAKGVGAIIGGSFGTSMQYGTNVGSTQTTMLAAQDSWFASGGVMTEFGPVPLRKYARGGIARSPQAAIFGEGAKPEAYVPLEDGRTIPVTMQGGGSVQNSVSVEVHNYGKEQARTHESVDSRGNRKVQVIIGETVAGEISRPGSNTNNALRQSFGLGNKLTPR